MVEVRNTNHYEGAFNDRHERKEEYASTIHEIKVSL